MLTQRTNVLFSELIRHAIATTYKESKPKKRALLNFLRKSKN